MLHLLQHHRLVVPVVHLVRLVRLVRLVHLVPLVRLALRGRLSTRAESLARMVVDVVGCCLARLDMFLGLLPRPLGASQPRPPFMHHHLPRHLRRLRRDLLLAS